MGGERRHGGDGQRVLSSNAAVVMANVDGGEAEPGKAEPGNAEASEAGGIGQRRRAAWLGGAGNEGGTKKTSVTRVGNDDGTYTTRGWATWVGGAKGMGDSEENDHQSRRGMT
ncbi:uncharacterized protein BXZ73DRAFT_80262 [Epithele typhae]|uniref:uncharacterized protein n=1 Tax=Epithele typhae TaxID=378194 RepID=UPI002008519C|nr:uncharacterized protein BXZ73DRAFT_80262 [Epithele typhae]KAH9920033.1 hypothetical protein BXZ73DRAFT_80262 [Epithele typhae]